MPADYDRIAARKRLLALREDSEQALGLREQVYIEQSADSADQVQAAEARELAITTLSYATDMLRKVNRALWRLDSGDYGTCAACGEAIGRKRLEAVPWAGLCLSCQEIADQHSSPRGSMSPVEAIPSTY